jgi:hypothetical protein
MLRDDLGLELYVSFNDCAPVNFQESLRRLCIGDLHPNSSIREAQDIRKSGEGAYNRDRFRKAISWIATHRRRAARLVAGRFRMFWLPDREEAFGPRMRYFVNDIVTILGLLGFCLCWRERRECRGLLASWLGLFPLIYYLVQFAPRYRYPILWILWLLSAHAVHAGVRSLGGELGLRTFKHDVAIEVGSPC